MTGKARQAELCFHGIGQPGRELEEGEERFWIDPATFRDILDVVSDFPGTALSFDDSNASDAEIAFPELARRAMPASFYVIAGRLGRPGSLTPDQVRALHGSGMSIGSHGMDHVAWQLVRSHEARHREFVAARDAISDVIGEAVTTAACPRGSYDRRSIRWLRDLGYQQVRIIDGGASSPGAWLRDRYSVTRFDDAESIAAYLAAPDGSRATRMKRALKGAVKRWR